MSVPAYSSYRNSGVLWIGDVPAHWTSCRLKHALEKMGSGGTPDTDNGRFWSADETGTPWVAIGDMSDRDQVVDTSKRLTAQGLASKGLEIWPAGTLLFSMYASLGHVAVTATPMAVNQAILALVPRSNVSQAYLKRWFEFLRPHLKAEASSNTQDNLNAGKVANLPVTLPPIAEQLAIAAFLDRETGKIDALVEAQRQLIELLKEKRHAVISHVITKGLDPSAPMKDSGVEWLGEVPAHWQVAPLMRLTAPGRDIMYGIVLPGPDTGEGVPIVKGGDVKPHRLKLSLLNWTTPEIEAPFARARLRPDDIVYSIRGSIGDAEPVPTELFNANITQDVARISPRSNVNSRWLLHVMRSSPIFVQLEQRSLGAAVRGINIFDLKRARVPVPPPTEQDDLAEFLDTKIKRLDGLTATAVAAITLLQERRSALIAAAVTGKIDVRGLVPAEAEAA